MGSCENGAYHRNRRGTGTVLGMKEAGGRGSTSIVIAGIAYRLVDALPQPLWQSVHAGAPFQGLALRVRFGNLD